MKTQTARPTPGPWMVEHGGPKPVQSNALYIVSADDGLGPVAFATTANARLIAAAPELAATLDQISRHAHAATVDGMTAADMRAILHTISNGAAAALAKAGA